MKKKYPAADFIACKQFSETIQTSDKIVFMRNTVYWLVGDSHAVKRTEKCQNTLEEQPELP